MRKIILVLIVFVSSSCKNSNDYPNKGLVVMNTSFSDHPGKKLMEINCYACHNPATKNSERIAPPMIAIKTHYKSDNITKEQFITDIQNWIEKPSEEKSKMPGAIRNFGLMPYAPYPEKTIQQIADYLYDNTIDEPDWFQEHLNQRQGKGNGRGMKMGSGMGHGGGKGKGKGMWRWQMSDSIKNYEELGLKYALSTKAQLGKNLIGAIQNKGTKEAVTFCNERAYSLTDSMSKVHNAHIKRVSDKPRNQNNKVNSQELSHIETFKEMVANQLEVKAIVDEDDSKVQFYYPIITNSLCLQCHGTLNKELEPSTYKTIKGLYPNDKAIGYKVNQVRGIWSISFNK